MLAKEVERFSHTAITMRQQHNFFPLLHKPAHKLIDELRVVVHAGQRVGGVSLIARRIARRLEDVDGVALRSERLDECIVLVAPGEGAGDEYEDRSGRHCTEVEDISSEIDGR
jgi:hypothetical protein